MEIYHIPVILITLVDFIFVYYIFKKAKKLNYGWYVRETKIIAILHSLQLIIYTSALYFWIVLHASEIIGGIMSPAEWLYVLSENLNGWIVFFICILKYKGLNNIKKGK